MTTQLANLDQVSAELVNLRASVVNLSADIVRRTQEGEIQSNGDVVDVARAVSALSGAIRSVQMAEQAHTRARAEKARALAQELTAKQKAGDLIDKSLAIKEFQRYLAQSLLELDGLPDKRMARFKGLDSKAAKAALVDLVAEIRDILGRRWI